MIRLRGARGLMGREEGKREQVNFFVLYYSVLILCSAFFPSLS